MNKYEPENKIAVDQLAETVIRTHFFLPKLKNWGIVIYLYINFKSFLERLIYKTYNPNTLFE